MLIFNGRQIVNTKGVMRIYIDAPNGEVGIYGSNQWSESIKLQSVANFDEGQRALKYILENYSDDLTIDYEEEE